MLTILTPTFNRKKRLMDLYGSLFSQTDTDFSWLVVDDGSNDNTGAMIEGLMSEAPFPIRYIYKENGGKHTALNAGVSTIESELTFIVDSDDTLDEEAVAVIRRYHEQYGHEAMLCGYAFLRRFPDGKINGKQFKPDEKRAFYIDERINGHDTQADKAEVFFTECLKEFPFPEYPGEKFLGEDMVWIRMSLKYKMLHVNKAIYIGNYLPDGLTHNRRRLNIISPIGCMQRGREYMRRELKLRYRIKGGLQYVIYGRFAGFSGKALYNQSDYKLLVLLLLLPGTILYYKWES